ncbi:MAG: type II toxin-antitoxin system VapC family toxin [Anaerolineales bacterium]|nr:type II toxin-antitoxin system VapC family toxin [Anaerolineales bacterium]
MLDTNACIQILNNGSPLLVRRMQSHSPTAIYLSTVVKIELVYGAYYSTRVAQNLRKLENFFAPFTSLPVDDTCVAHAGQIRADLQRTGTPIGPYDLLIAATAVAHNLILVTHNTREFERVTGLLLEDWELP